MENNLVEIPNTVNVDIIFNLANPNMISYIDCSYIVQQKYIEATSEGTLQWFDNKNDVWISCIKSIDVNTLIKPNVIYRIKPFIFDLTNIGKLPYNICNIIVQQKYIEALNNGLCQFYNIIDGKWIDIGKLKIFNTNLAYRIPPKRKYREWIVKDIPHPLCIIKEIEAKNRWLVDYEYVNDGLYVINNRFISFKTLYDKFEYSIDGITYNPCKIEIEI